MNISQVVDLMRKIYRARAFNSTSDLYCVKDNFYIWMLIPMPLTMQRQRCRDFQMTVKQPHEIWKKINLVLSHVNLTPVYSTLKKLFSWFYKYNIDYKADKALEKLIDESYKNNFNNTINDRTIRLQQPITVSLQHTYSLLFKVILKKLHKQPLLQVLFLF